MTLAARSVGRTDVQVDLSGGDLLVTAGHVDCFALEERVLGEPGRRRPLFTVAQGGVLLQVDADGDRPPLIAVPSLGACIEPLAGSPTADQRDAWAQRLLRACVTAPAGSLDHADPVSEHDLLAGARLGFGRDARILKVERGTIRLGGVVEWSRADGPVLVIDPLWVEAASDARLLLSHAADPRDGIAGLHGFAVSAIAALLDERAETEGRRLAAKAERESGALAESLQALAGIGRRQGGRRHSAPHGDPVATAIAPILTAFGLQPGSFAPFATVEDALAAYGLRYRRVLLRPGWRVSGITSFVGYLGEASVPVAVIPNGRGWRLRGKGVDLPLDDGVESELRLEAVQVYRGLPQATHSFRALLRFGATGTLADIGRAVLSAIVAASAALAVPLALAAIFDDLLPTGDRSGLETLILLLLAAALAAGGFAVANAIALLRVETRFEVNVSPALVDRLLRLPTRFFRSYTVGDLVDRLLGIQRARLLVSNNLASMLTGSIVVATSLLLLIVFDPGLAAISALLLGVLAFATLSISWRQRRLARANLGEVGRLDGLMLQLIVGIAKLRGAAAEGRAMTAWATRYAPVVGRSTDIRRLGAIQEIVDGVYPPIAMGVLYLIVARIGSVSTGGAVAILAAFAQALAAIMVLARATSGVAQAEPLIERAQPLLQTPTETHDVVEPIGVLDGNIGFRAVSFRYADDAPLVVDEVSLDIPSGSHVAFVGPSGSGKSTILRLLLGFERPTKGEVLFDGRSAARLDPVQLRRQFGVVLQNGRIFSGSILDNILGPARLDISEAWAAARMVGLDRDIEDMPMGMHTVLLDGGSSISGGQRQRILIARALVHRPRILLFDEATSALDNRTQEIVTQTLARMSITRIVIAHRLTTIENVDRVFVMERGRLIQQGSFRDLLDSPGVFAELARRQMLGH